MATAKKYKQKTITKAVRLCLDRSINWGCNRWCWGGKQTMDLGWVSRVSGEYLKIVSLICCSDTFGLMWKFSHSRQFMISFVNHHKVKRAALGCVSLTFCYVMLFSLAVLYANFPPLLCRLNNFTSFFSDVFYFRLLAKIISHNLGLARAFLLRGGFSFCWLTAWVFGWNEWKNGISREGGHWSECLQWQSRRSEIWWQ